MSSVKHENITYQVSPQPAASKSRTKLWLLGLAMVAGLALAACGQGAYPLDIFYEMHYQQSHKSQEPPRVDGVKGAVAWFPEPQNTTAFGSDGEYLYTVNCAMCHGADGRGNGPVLQQLVDEYGYTPLLDPDLTSEPVMTMGRSGVESLMAGGLNVMPSFSKLLTVEEMQAISGYIEQEIQP